MGSQLLRTNIALTGNVKLCCYVDGTKVTGASLNPISTSLPIIPYRINLLNSTYDRDIVKFYKTYANDFYTPYVKPRLCDAGVYNEYVPEDIYETGFCMDSCYGMKRVSLEKNGKQFSLFAPVFINSEYELPRYAIFNIGMKRTLTEEYDTICTKTIDLATSGDPKNPESNLYSYLKRSYDDINGDNSLSCRIMKLSIEPDDLGLCKGIIRGWSVERSGIVNNTTNLTQKIFSHDLTLTEFDSRICDEYRQRKMIMPHIVNLCWYFNLEDFLPLYASGVNLTPGQRFNVNVSYMDESGKVFDVADIDFNHYNIQGKEGNLLDYLHEYDVPAIRDNIKEHISPVINGWTLSESNNTYRFNAFLGYNGFRLDDGRVINPYTIYNFDLLETTPVENAHNLGWINFISGSRTTTISNIGGITDNNIVMGTPAHPEGTIRDFYYNFPEMLKRYNIFDAGNGVYTVICNGVKFKVDRDYLIKYITCGTSEYPYVKISDNMSVSISCTCNYKHIECATPDETYQYLVYKDHKEGGVTYIDDICIVFWIPDYIGNEYDMRDALEYLTIGNIFGTRGKPLQPKIYHIVNDNRWEHVAFSNGSNKFNLNAGMLGSDGLLTLINPIYYNATDIISSIPENDGYSLYNSKGRISGMSRYMGWIQPALIRYTKNELSRWSSEYNNYICYKKHETHQDGTIDNMDERANGIGIMNIKGADALYTNYNPRRLCESKWFYASTGCYVPNSYRYIHAIGTGYESKDDIINKIIGKIINPDNLYKGILLTDDINNDYIRLREYVKTLYNISWDMDANKTNYIIKLKLK